MHNLLVTPLQLMRHSIGRNRSCTASDICTCSFLGAGPVQRVTSVPALFWEQVLRSGWHPYLLFSGSRSYTADDICTCWEQVLYSRWHLYLLFSGSKIWYLVHYTVSWPAIVFFGEAMFIGVMSNIWIGVLDISHGIQPIRCTEWGNVLEAYCLIRLHFVSSQHSVHNGLIVTSTN